MSETITIGSSDYESYSSVAQADDYFNASTDFATWDGYSTDEKARALVSATRLIDRQTWAGSENTDIVTDLAFPRTGLTYCDGTAVDETTIPPEIVEACQILALYLATGTDIQTSNTGGQVVKRLKADTVEIEYQSVDLDDATRFPLPVMELVKCFMGSSVQIAGSLSYGVDGESVDNDFTVTKGF